MNKQLLPFMLTALMCIAGIKAFAHDIEVVNADGVTIYYVWTNNKTELAVSYRGDSSSSYSDEYSGIVAIPESVVYNDNTYEVTSIGNRSFNDCSGLKSVSIPNSIKNIGGGAFYNCISLESVVFPEGVETISPEAFKGCSSLKTVSFPSSLTKIGEEAFKGCSDLSSVQISDLESWCKVFLSYSIVDDSGPFYGSHHLYLNGKEITDLIIPNSLTVINSWLFSGCAGINSVTIPEGVTSIYGAAFKGCTDLTSVTIPNSMTYLVYNAFDNTGWYNDQKEGVLYLDKWLIGYKGDKPTGELSIVEGTKGIAVHAFKNCAGLTTVTIPNSVKSIGISAFSGCTDLTTIISEIEAPFAIDDNVFYSNDKNIFETATLIVPKGTKDIYQSTEGWKKFTNIFEASEQITKSIHVVKAGTLSNYITNAEKYQIGNLTVTGEINGTDLGFLREMAGRKSYVDYYYNHQSPVDYTTEGTLSILDISNTNIIAGGTYYTEIERETGGYTDHSETRVLSNDNTLPRGVFNGCKFKTIILPNNLKSIGSKALSSTDLASIMIPKSVASISGDAFAWCRNLQSITVEEENMNYDSRHNCNAIINNNNQLIVGCKNTIIPNSVTSIGDNAFSGCTGLVYITLPSNLNSIGNSAFSGCNSLIDAYCKAETPPSANYAFSNYENITLHVPSASLEAYKSTEPWSLFKAYYILSNNDLEATEKCSTPTISIANGKCVFSCETSGVSYRWSITSQNGTNGNVSSTISLPIILNVYATKSGYLNSDVATYEFNGLVGDVDGNGVVNVADHVKLSSIIMDQK